MNEQIANVKFVLEVEKYPCLYDYHLLEYSRKDVTETAWINVAVKTNLSVSACKKKWKNLRAVFVRHMKHWSRSSGSKKKRYYLQDVMKFLLPYIKTISHTQLDDWPEETATDVLDDVEEVNVLSTKSECESPTMQATDDNEEEKLSSGPIRSLPSTSVTRQTKILKRKRPLDEVNRSSVDGDLRKMFLLSLLEEINQMTEEQMKLFKRKVLSLIDEIMSPATTYTTFPDNFEMTLSESSNPCSISGSSNRSNCSPVNSNIQDPTN